MPEIPTTRRHLRFLRGWRLVAVAFALAFTLMLVIRSFFFEIYYIPSDSMEPTLMVGDRVVVQRGNADIQRGDLIVFDGEGSFSPYNSASPWLSNPVRTAGQWLGLMGSDTVYVKRVIGVGGDTVQCCSPAGHLVVNGQELEESYLPADMKASELTFSVEVPAGRLWLMGDNRGVSVDSRALLGAPGGGMIQETKVIGKPVLVVYPASRWQAL